MKTQKLNITFHNPNALDALVKELIMVYAEVAKAKVSDTLLHIENTKKEEQAV